MTKRKSYLAILAPLTFLGLWFISKKLPETSPDVPKVSQAFVPMTSLQTPQRSPASVAQKLPSQTSQKDTVHFPWKSQLEKTLFTQGAGTVKKVEVEKVDVFNWKIGKVDVPVDSVIVKIQNMKGNRTSFRAIVDSHSGKILQTWDHPVIDNFNGSRDSAIKLDPRYHQDNL